MMLLFKVLYNHLSHGTLKITFLSIPSYNAPFQRHKMMKKFLLYNYNVFVTSKECFIEKTYFEERIFLILPFSLYGHMRATI